MIRCCLGVQNNIHESSYLNIAHVLILFGYMRLEEHDIYSNQALQIKIKGKGKKQTQNDIKQQMQKANMTRQKGTQKPGHGANSKFKVLW